MMRRKILFIVGSIVVLAAAAVTIAYTAGRDELARVRSATKNFQTVEAVQAAGYSLVPDLDYCFDNPGVGGMGFHYINTSSLDTSLDPLKPEAMVYAPQKDGQLELAAVEYIVPAEAWDADHSEPPMLLGQHLHLNKDLGVYVLHAWIWKKNPSGVFQDWNPQVGCPK